MSKDLAWIISQCECGVFLSVNEYRDYYMSIAEAIEDDRIDDEGAVRSIKETGEIYRLQFYPDTPIGFHVVWGGTLAEVISQAVECLDERRRQASPAC